MAPVQVIDLTSSPEPDDTPARVAALSQFQPRKQKVAAGHGIPTVPVNGLPFFYDNYEQRAHDDKVQHSLREGENPQPGATAGANEVPVGSGAPRTLEESKEDSVRGNGATAPLSQVPGKQSFAFSNGTPHIPPACNRNTDYEHGRQAASNVTREHPGNGSRRGASSSNNSTNPGPREDSTPTYSALIDSARPLTGISQECRARLYEQRDALAGTPLDYAIQRDISGTQSRLNAEASASLSELHVQHQHGAVENHKPNFALSSKKTQFCPVCSKGFIRSEKMQGHRQRCEARSNARSPDRNAIPVASQVTGSQTDIQRGESSNIVSMGDVSFNALKRPLHASHLGPDERSIGNAKRARVNSASLSTQHQAHSRVRLVNVTDDTMESFVLSDESNNPPPSLVHPQLVSSSEGATIATVDQRANGLSSGASRNGLPYSAEEDALLIKLKEVDRLPFSAIVARFNGRTQGSLAVRYSTKCKKKPQRARQEPDRSPPPALRSNVPPKLVRKTNIASGMVPWASVKKARLEETQDVELQRDIHRRKRLKEQHVHGLHAEADIIAATASEDDNVGDSPELQSKDSAYPSSMSRILRLREMGVHGRRAWAGNVHPVPDELKDHVFSNYGLQRDYQGTSGDVISLAWSDNGRFAASSIAIADQQSMQYNMHRNLLVGDTIRGEVREVLEHHVPRPVVENKTNINANHAMRESQDPRLFLSVVAAKFCPQDSTRLFTAGMDKTLRHFKVEADEVTHRHAIQHTSPVTLLGVGGGHGLVATGCHQASQNINIFKCDTRRHEVKLQLSPRQMNAPVYPSALKWGVANQHRNFLLAGFSSEDDVATSTATGETCLWDASTGQRIHLAGAIRNVFDVAWNPIPSSSSIAFAIAGNANGLVVDKGMRSVIQCFAAGQKGGRGVLEWQCPALDINDLVFCPYDDNLIAAGTTNGRVYIWDKRSADRSQRPLHTLKHGESLNVLDHDRDAEIADTGIQFLAWGPTKNRLFSGSSDGIVKTWNPYRSPRNAHIGDISGPARDRSAVMSGAFSPDFQELLIGTENGRINLFKSGSEAVSRKPPPFKLIPGPEADQKQEEPFVAARSLIETGQIEMRPCGAMLITQAVQGPNYSGPFLHPSETQLREAEQRLSMARLAQLRLRDGVEEADYTKAAKEVESAEELVQDLLRRIDLSRSMLPKAEAFQRELAESEKNRKELEALLGKVEQCHLDCAFLQQGHDGDEDEEEVEDSGRSELRIPGFLRYVTSAASKLEDSEQPSTCTGCFPPKPKTKKKAPNLCTTCVLKRARLTSTCTKCGNATRPQMEEGKSAICERCAFGCFRCGMPLKVSEEFRFVHCVPCGLEWEMGALGYELVRSSTSAAPKVQKDFLMDDNDMDDVMELGDEDREFHASRWDLVGNMSRRYEV